MQANATATGRGSAVVVVMDASAQGAALLMLPTPESRPTPPCKYHEGPRELNSALHQSSLHPGRRRQESFELRLSSVRTGQPRRCWSGRASTSPRPAPPQTPPREAHLLVPRCTSAAVGSPPVKRPVRQRPHTHTHTQGAGALPRAAVGQVDPWTPRWCVLSDRPLTTDVMMELCEAAFMPR